MTNLMETVVYAGRIKNRGVLNSSSSGGAFTVISDLYLENGDAVVASIYDYHEQTVKYQLILNTDQRDRAKGSKYMQSKPGNVFREAYQWLVDHPDHHMLFVGTGCQADGFRKYVEMKGIRERVCIVDIVCHGSPSSKIWKEYVQYIQNKNDGLITYLTFKDKRNGWISPTAYVKIDTKEVPIEEYVRIFYNHCALRPSCYECPYTKIERKTDLTIGDFWHIEETIPDFYDVDGNSLFLIHTTLGETLFDMVKGKLDYRLSNTTQCWQENLARPTNRPEMREEFWSNYYKKGINFIVKKYGTVPIKAKIRNRLLKIMGGGTQKVIAFMLETPKGGQHNELEAA